MTLKAFLKKYEQIAEKQNLEVEAIRFLVLELSGLQPHQFYLVLDDTLDEALKIKLEQALDAYIYKEIPVQHLLGYGYFYGHKFIVNKDVLIPRRETEELVEQVLIYYDTYFKDQVVKTLDLGCGSGCIAVTLSKEESHMQVTGADISQEALVVARQNSEQLKTDTTFIQSDWFSNIEGQFDIIVANPPYIPAKEEIGRTVDKEPELALFGGDDGLKFYRIILEQAKSHLKEKSLLAFEHGYQQKEAIHHLIKQYFNNSIIIQTKDLQDKDRFTFVGLGGVLGNE